MAREPRRRSRAFRPTLGASSTALALEPRQLLARVSVAALVAARQAARAHTGPQIRLRPGIGDDGIPNSPKPYVQTGVADGGRGAVIIDTDGELYVAHLTGGGVVLAKSVPGGKVDLTLYGTNPNSVLTIDPEAPLPGKHVAHDFPLGAVTHDGLVHVRNITVANGKMGEIAGYKTADVSGAIKVLGKNPALAAFAVDRIAFYALRPGASIEVAHDLNTLDIYDSIRLDGGRGIRTGRDLNWFNTGSDLTLDNGASIIAGRDIGLLAQGAKGTGPAGQGGLIRGNLVLGQGSTIAPERFIDAPIIVQGGSGGISNLPPQVQAATVVFGHRG
jgi:hypothetical protein